VIDLRKSERFQVLEQLDGLFGVVEVTLLNVALGGVQLGHAQPLRIGTRARFVFHRGDIAVSIAGRVVWSHLSQTEAGLLYKSGVQLDDGEVQYAAALATFLRAGIIARDTSSLDRKRQRELEREQRRASSSKMQVIPPST
jgi:hypothetical protein